MAAATTARMSRVRRTERLHFAAGLRLPSACRSSGTRTSVRTVDREWLERRLSNGLSVDAIAADAGCSASSVGYWINHFGLWPPQRAQSGRGGLEADELGSLVQQGLSVRQIAAACGVSATTVRRWLRRHRPSNQPLSLRATGRPEAARDSARVPSPRLDGIPSTGSRGWLSLRRAAAPPASAYDADASGSCSSPRQAVHARSAATTGTRARCSSTTSIRARSGFTSRSAGLDAFARSRFERRRGKCVLLCANCHARGRRLAVTALCLTAAAQRPIRGSSIGRALGC